MLSFRQRINNRELKEVKTKQQKTNKVNTTGTMFLTLLLVQQQTKHGK